MGTLVQPSRESLEQIYDLDDHEDVSLLKELCQILLEESPRSLDELFQANRSGRLDIVDRIAHGLKSSFGNVGFQGMSDLFNEIMTQARHGDVEQTRTLVRRVEEASATLLEGVEAFMDAL